MQGEEKIYFRKSLGVECSSTQAAYSYLDGRVDQKEIFLLDGKEMFFSDIFVQDERVRKIVRAHKTLDELFPPHKQKTFSERYALFKKIVLRGDDSSALFLAELDEKKEQLSKQRVELDEKKKLINKQRVELDEKKKLINKQRAELDERKKQICKQRAEIDRNKELISKQRVELDGSKYLISKQREELDEKKELISKQQAELDEKKEQLSKPRAELDGEKYLISKLSAELDKKKELISKQREELDEKKEELSKQRKDLKYRKELLRCRKNYGKLVGVGRNTIQVLRELAIIIETQKKGSSAYSFIHDSEVLATIKQLAENLRETMGWNGDAAVQQGNELLPIRTLEKINDFREKTDCKNRVKKAEVKQLTAIANAKINAELEALRKEKERILQEMKDVKAKAFYEIQEERSLCERKIQEAKEKERASVKAWKNSVMASLQVKADELRTLKKNAGMYELSVREYVKKLFGKFAVSSPRYYAFPVPEKILYNSIRSCVDNGKLADVAPRDVLAVFDCSRMKDGTCGILVSTHAFYLFNEEIKKKYQLHRDNKINAVLKKSKWRIYWAWYGVFSLVFSFVLVVFYYNANAAFSLSLFFAFFSFLLAFLSAPKIMIKCNGVVMMTYSHRRVCGIERFCDNINELCTYFAVDDKGRDG